MRWPSHLSIIDTMTIRDIYARQKQKRRRFIGIMVILILVSSFAGLCIGSVMVSPQDVLVTLGHMLFPDQIAEPGRWQEAVVFRIYAPRIVLAAFTGFSLAIAGTVMQSTLRNPLVSPFTLGLSSAAGFGAALAIVLIPAALGGAALDLVLGPVSYKLSSLLTVCSAFFFGLLSIGIVLVIGRKRSTSRSIMILSGVIIGYLFQAGITALKYISNDAALREITEWLMGGMWGADWNSVVIVVPVTLVCAILIIKDSQVFNAITSGDDVAKTLGIDIDRFRRRSLVIVTLSSSVCLAFTGIIGFIGLMAPHICRMIIGNDQRFLVPASGLLGAMILLVSDTVARTVLAPIEIPVGVIMYVLGGAFFIYLIMRKGREAMD